MSPVSISVRDLTLEYKVHQYRTTSLKEFVMNRIQGKTGHSVIRALNNVQLYIHKGESVALIGHNGCGKSTLLKCIAGIYQPKNSKVHIEGRVAPMIELGAGFDQELSGRENIRLSCMLMGLTSHEVNERIEKIIDFSEIRPFIDIPFKNYSSGMQARLGFACATSVDPDVLLVDEVLAVGDTNFAKKCLDRINSLKERGITVVLVSHDFNTVRSFCNRGIVIDKGQIVFDGAVEDAILKQQTIMDKRYLENLSEAERQEALRIHALKVSEFEESARIPQLKLKTKITQLRSETDEITVNDPFTLTFEFEVNNPERFDTDISVGFGINKRDGGYRIGGCNNLIKQTAISKDQIINGRFSVSFNFDDGIPNLASGDYKIYCGVHDRNISRNILHCEAINIRATNKFAPVNMNRDILELQDHVSSIGINSANEQ